MNSVVKKTAISFLIEVKTTQHHTNNEKYFLPNSNPMIDSLCSITQSSYQVPTGGELPKLSSEVAVREGKPFLQCSSKAVLI